MEKSIKYKVKNIFVEKPISDNLKKIEKFRKKYPKYKNKILVGYVLLFNELFTKTLSLIQKDKIGTIISANVVCNSNFKNWRKNKQYYKLYLQIKN